MAHKYDDRYVKGGCAYWTNSHRWPKINSNRKRRKRVKRDLKRMMEDFFEDLSQWYSDKWDINY